MKRSPSDTIDMDVLVDGCGVDDSDPDDVLEPPAAVTESQIESLLGLSPEHLDARVRELELQRRRLDAELAVTIAVADQRQLYLTGGNRSMQAYLRATCSWASPTASVWCSVSRLVTQHLVVGDSLAAGRIGFDQVAELAEAHDNLRLRGRFAEFLPIMLTAAEQLGFAEFRLVVKEFAAKEDSEGAHLDRDRAVEHRNAHACVNGSELDVSVVGGDPVTATEVVSIIQQFVDAEYAADVAQRLAEFGDDAEHHPLPRTAGQRRFDAFVKLVRTAGINRTAVDGGEPTPATNIVNINIDQDTFEHLLAESGLAPNRGDINADLAGWLSDPDNLEQRRCETSDGVPVHPHDVLRALLHGYVRRVVVDAKGVVVDMGRLSRLYTGTAREAALLLLRFCQHPGCTLPASRSQVDHNIEWHRGGRTDQDNATVRCGYHNRWKHKKRWQTKRATNGYFYSIRDDGTVVLPVGARPPTFADDDTPRLDWSQFHFGGRSWHAFDWPDIESAMSIARHHLDRRAHRFPATSKT